MHSLHWLYLVKKLQVPTSSHLIFFFPSRAFKSPFTFKPYSHWGSLSLALPLSLSLSFPLFPLPLAPSLSLSFFLSLAVDLSVPRSAFHVNPLGGVAEGGLMASLSGVLAAVLLQLLGCDKERKGEKFSH